MGWKGASAPVKMLAQGLLEIWLALTREVAGDESDIKARLPAEEQTPSFHVLNNAAKNNAAQSKQAPSTPPRPTSLFLHNSINIKAVHSVSAAV